MACKCKKLHGRVKCTNCGTTKEVLYKETSTPVATANRQSLRCKVCKQTNFEEVTE